MASDLPVIAVALRTPIGEVHGALSGCHPADLLAAVLLAVGEQAAIDPQQVDELIVGCAMPVGAQSDIGRAALLAAGWPATIPAETLAQHSSSSMAALLRAAQAVRSGAAEVAVAAGVEVMSLVPMGAAAMARHAYGKPWGDRVAALRRRRRAAARRRARRRARPCSFHRPWRARRVGTPFAFPCSRRDRTDGRAADRRRHRVHPRRSRRASCSREIGDIAELGPMFEETGSVTAANRAAIADGAVAILVTTAARARQMGLTPLCSIRGGGAAARGPRDIEPAAIGAIQRALHNARAEVGRLDRVEIHEGHAATVLHVIDCCGFAVDRVNPDGWLDRVGSSHGRDRWSIDHRARACAAAAGYRRTGGRRG